jgi:hypothetical protein
MPNPPNDKTRCGREPEPADERPPLFSSWKKLYAVVLLHLAFLIVIYYLFTKAFE